MKLAMLPLTAAMEGLIWFAAPAAADSWWQAGKIFPERFWQGMVMLALIWGLLGLATVIS